MRKDERTVECELVPEAEFNVEQRREVLPQIALPYLIGAGLGYSIGRTAGALLGLVATYALARTGQLGSAALFPTIFIDAWISQQRAPDSREEGK